MGVLLSITHLFTLFLVLTETLTVQMIPLPEIRKMRLREVK